MKKEFQDFLTSADSCQSFVDVLSPVFRKYKAKLKEAQEQYNHHHSMAIPNNPDDLRNSCENLKEENLVLKEEFLKEYIEVSHQLNKIDSIAGEKAVKYELNVDSYGLVDSDQDLSIVFEKFLTSIQDFNDSSSSSTSKKAKHIKYNYSHIDKHLKYVEKERLKLTDLQSHIKNDLLKPLISKNLAQKNDRIDWKSAFEQRQPLKEVDVLLPNTPGVRIQTSPVVKTTKFLLDPSEKSREMTTINSSNNLTSKSMIMMEEEQSKDEFDVSVKQSTPTVVNEIQVWSPEQSRISVVGDRIRLDSTPKTRRNRR